MQVCICILTHTKTQTYTQTDRRPLRLLITLTNALITTMMLFSLRKSYVGWRNDSQHVRKPYITTRTIG